MPYRDDAEAAQERIAELEAALARRERPLAVSRASTGRCAAYLVVPGLALVASLGWQVDRVAQTESRAQRAEAAEAECRDTLRDAVHELDAVRHPPIAPRLPRGTLVRARIRSADPTHLHEPGDECLASIAFDPETARCIARLTCFARAFAVSAVTCVVAGPRAGRAAHLRRVDAVDGGLALDLDAATLTIREVDAAPIEAVVIANTPFDLP